MKLIHYENEAFQNLLRHKDSQARETLDDGNRKGLISTRSPIAHELSFGIQFRTRFENLVSKLNHRTQFDAFQSPIDFDGRIFTSGKSEFQAGLRKSGIQL